MLPLIAVIEMLSSLNLFLRFFFYRYFSVPNIDALSRCVLMGYALFGCRLVTVLLLVWGNIIVVVFS